MTPSSGAIRTLFARRVHQRKKRRRTMWERNKKEIVLGISAVLALGAGTLWVATGSNGSQADAATGPVARKDPRPRNLDHKTGKTPRPKLLRDNKDHGGGKTKRDMKDPMRGGKDHRVKGKRTVTKKRQQPKPAA